MHSSFQSKEGYIEYIMVFDKRPLFWGGRGGITFFEFIPSFKHLLVLLALSNLNSSCFSGVISGPCKNKILLSEFRFTHCCMVVIFLIKSYILHCK